MVILSGPGAALIAPAAGLAGDLEAADDPTTLPLRVGIVGLDTSHVVAFTQLLNAEKPKPALAGVRVVAAYPGGSPDIPSSRDRVAGYTRELKEKYGVAIVDSIDELLTQVNVVLLESVDGRPHLEQARPLFRAHKPVFIDKPVAGSLADAVAIFDLARETNTPCFSSSSLRFSPGIAALAHDPKARRDRRLRHLRPLRARAAPSRPVLVRHARRREPVHDHGNRLRDRSPGPTPTGTDLVVGVWKDGRIGTFRGNRRAPAKYGGTVFGTKGIAPVGDYGGYEPLVVEIVKFFKTGKPPVSAEETIEIFAFMEAADESKRQGGRPVTIESVLARARQAAAKAAPGAKNP